VIKVKNLFIFGLFSTISLFANSMDTNIIKFEKERFSNNSRVEIKSIDINTKVQMPINGWYGYIIDIKALVQNKDVTAKDIVFSNGEFVAPELIDLKTGNSLKLLLQPKLSDNFYSPNHLIEGNKDAENKIVIFSDPLCPFCIDYVPEVIKHVKKNKEEIALYYYHFPLSKIHPAADILVKAMDVAKKKGIKDVELKVYETDWETYFKIDSKDVNLILNAFNKVFKTEIKESELNQKEITESILKDINMGEDVLVKGTPTIFINGEKDNTRLKYESLGSN